MIRPIFCWYGDDFTGSTDALEAVASNGIPSVLFLDPPDEAMLAKFADCRAVGIAGESRSRGPAWMEEHLPAIFQSLKNCGAPVCQYKVCSTFDSSPERGSIGRAMEIGQRIFACPWTPIAVAAPHLKRYVLFGNLFAAAAGAIHRIDRHPAMSRHPVTPMHEADLRLHLANQTSQPIGLIDILSLRQDDFRPSGAVLFDGLEEDSIREAGRLIWTNQASFCVGSSGLTHALMLHWKSIGLIPAQSAPVLPGAADRLIVISGSCSPATEAQIRWAMRHGYSSFRLGDGAEAAALAELDRGRSVVIYTALGPTDYDEHYGGETLGRELGSLLLRIVKQSGVRRAAICGGDTSSHAVRRLGIEALTFAGLLTPGAPLCRAHAADSQTDGLELVLKGGQVGPEDFFDMIRKGTA